jgi:tetratricopeptide (TPR) repeat protein
VSPSSLKQALEIAIEHHTHGSLAEAEAGYRKLLEVQPDQVDALHLLGVIHLQRGDLVAAEALIRGAIAIDASLAVFHNNLGAVLRGMGRMDEAADAFRAAVTLAPEYAEAHSNLGTAMLALGDFERSLEAFRRSLVLNPRNPQAHCNLGAALLEYGRLEEAAACFNAALEIDPGYSAAFHYLSLTRASSAVPQDEIALAERTLAEGEPGIDQRIHLHFALGRMLDQEERFEEAFHHIAEANRLQRGRTVYDPARHEQLIDRTIDLFTPAFFESFRELGCDSELPVFIVGMPRSGTTLVEQILASHDQVFGAGELGYFQQLEAALSGILASAAPYPTCSGALGAAEIDALARGYLSLLRSLPGARHAHRVTDKMPDNFLHLGLIAMLFPRARIIHCRRDPLDTCLSIYFQKFTGDYPYAYDLSEIGRYYLAYRRLMAHWKAVLPIPVLEVDYEALVADQEGVSRQLVAFCGLEWRERCLRFFQTERSVKTASSAQVRRPLYAGSVGRWRHYEAHLEALAGLRQTPA